MKVKWVSSHDPRIQGEIDLGDMAGSMWVLLARIGVIVLDKEHLPILKSFDLTVWERVTEIVEENGQISLRL